MSRKWKATADPIPMHGLSSKGEHWYRRPVWDDIPCANCGTRKASKAMYEYGISESDRGHSDTIQWDSKVFCNLSCLPDDTKEIRRQRWSLRLKDANPIAERKRQSNKAVAEKKRAYLSGLYRKHKSIIKVAEIAGISKQRVSVQLKRAGVKVRDYDTSAWEATGG